LECLGTNSKLSFTITFIVYDMKKSHPLGNMKITVCKTGIL